MKRTGCKYTGITLSEEQLKFAEMKVKEAGLQVKLMNMALIWDIGFFFRLQLLLHQFPAKG